MYVWFFFFFFYEIVSVLGAFLSRLHEVLIYSLDNEKSKTYDIGRANWFSIIFWWFQEYFQKESHKYTSTKRLLKIWNKNLVVIISTS